MAQAAPDCWALATSRRIQVAARTAAARPIGAATIRKLAATVQRAEMVNSSLERQVRAGVSQSRSLIELELEPEVQAKERERSDGVCGLASLIHLVGNVPAALAALLRQKNTVRGSQQTGAQTPWPPIRSAVNAAAAAVRSQLCFQKSVGAVTWESESTQICWHPTRSSARHQAVELDERAH